MNPPNQHTFSAVLNILAVYLGFRPLVVFLKNFTGPSHPNMLNGLAWNKWLFYKTRWDPSRYFQAKYKRTFWCFALISGFFWRKHGPYLNSGGSLRIVSSPSDKILYSRIIIGGFLVLKVRSSSNNRSKMRLSRGWSAIVFLFSRHSRRVLRVYRTEISKRQWPWALLIKSSISDCFPWKLFIFFRISKEVSFLMVIVQ